jgi:hypothetical protein
MRAYALHRKESGLPGQSHGAVRKAIDRETLVESVSYNARNKVSIDFEVADREWANRTDPAQVREPGVAKGRFSDGEDRTGQGGLFPDMRPPADPADQNKGPSLKTAQAVKLSFQARLTQLDFEERSGKLCQVDRVKVEAFRTARLVRDKVLNVADRIGAPLAAETDAHACREMLIRELNVALEELAEAGSKEYSN